MSDRTPSISQGINVSATRHRPRQSPSSRRSFRGVTGGEAKLADGRIVMGASAVPQGQATGSILLVHESWGLLDHVVRRPLVWDFV